ncbi:hypothetical protein [Salininema proteolyticum]|uniref:MarR family transcriptional regulator n=1 Tax=Salininema proteolyticum TaxID=1607685 RepID=A0ABV8U3W3_9ACTN
MALTPEGREVVDDIFPRQVEAEAEALRGLGADREKVVEALGALLRVLDESAG